MAWIPGFRSAADQAFLVSTPDGVVQLVWRGVRHRIADATTLEAIRTACQATGSAEFNAE